MTDDTARRKLIEWVAAAGFRYTGRPNHQVLFHASAGKDGDPTTLHERAQAAKPITFRKFKRAFTDAGFTVKRTTRWIDGRPTNVYWLHGFR